MPPLLGDKFTQSSLVSLSLRFFNPNSSCSSTLLTPENSNAILSPDPAFPSLDFHSRTFFFAHHLLLLIVFPPNKTKSSPLKGKRDYKYS